MTDFILSADSGVFSSIGSSLTHSDDHLIDRREYHTYQTLLGMQVLCRAIAYTTHKVTLNKFGGITFESIASRAVVPIGNVTQLSVRLETLHRKWTGHRWHELHVGGWAIILKNDDDAEQWVADLCNVRGGQFFRVGSVLTVNLNALLLAHS